MCVLENQELTVDLSELQGRKFVCSDECQLCCLCQPELLEKEVPYFKRNFPDRLVVRRSPHKHTALALKNGKVIAWHSGKRILTPGPRNASWDFPKNG